MVILKTAFPVFVGRGALIFFKEFHKIRRIFKVKLISYFGYIIIRV